ncbi:MAG: hypothetical protein ABEJ31_09715 [Haloarculaceae archaeon]
MSTTATARDWLDRVRPERETLLWAALLVNAELLVMLVYLGTTDGGPRSLWALRFWVYPFVWIDVGLLAVLATSPAPTTDRQRYVGAAIAVGYFAVLAYTGGLIGPGTTRGIGWRVATTGLPPGWGPALLYSGPHAKLVLMPFKVIGYLALTYLVYATVIDAAASAIGGVLGLLSCVSCSWPVLASIASSVLGSGSAIAGAVTAQSYGLSTIVFVVTVGLLYWRPTIR